MQLPYSINIQSTLTTEPDVKIHLQDMTGSMLIPISFKVWNSKLSKESPITVPFKSPLCNNKAEKLEVYGYTSDIPKLPSRASQLLKRHTQWIHQHTKPTIKYDAKWHWLQHHSPLTTHRSPLTTHHSPLTTHHSPFTTHPSPLTAHHSPLTIHH